MSRCPHQQALPDVTLTYVACRPQNYVDELGNVIPDAVVDQLLAEAQVRLCSCACTLHCLGQCTLCMGLLLRLTTRTRCS